MTDNHDNPLCLLSFDVEEVFQIEAAWDVVSRESWQTRTSRVEQAMDWILQTLNDHNAKATCFTLGWIARRHPKMIKRIVDEGHELACHGEGHERLMRLNPDSFREDVITAKQTLEDLGGTAVRGYRAPTWSITRETRWAIDVLRDCGFLYDSSIQPVRHPQYGVPEAPTTPYRFPANADRAALYELPPLTRRAFIGGGNMAVSGGGYFRLYPLRLMLGGIHKMHGNNQPSVIYFHPWELDPTQPKLPLPTLQRWRTYVGLKSARQKFTRLLRQTHCQPLGTWLDQQNKDVWEEWDWEKETD